MLWLKLIRANEKGPRPYWNMISQPLTDDVGQSETIF